MAEAEQEPDAIGEAMSEGLLTAADDLPDDLDPLADGILMAHQKEYIADKSVLKLVEKCRRSGFTFAEALDDTITAATARSEGGRNVFYIGDTKDKGREFIGYCAHFAKIVAGELGRIDEIVFEDQKPDGSSKHISAFRITFASGNRIVALSSRPENIRGLQGIVVIDEAAFHKDVGEVIDSAMALLIWGGAVRIISTHNGRLNPFNELVVRTRAGKTEFSIHRITFDEVVENGLYDRVKLINPEIMPFDEWVGKVRNGYVDEARMREELDAIPRDAEGSALSRVQVEACKDAGIIVKRLKREDGFKLEPEAAREVDIRAWLSKNIAPVLKTLDINRRTVIGGDLARKGHGSVFWLAQVSPTLQRETRLVVEARNLPFDNLRQVLWYIFDRAGRRWTASLDASGLGMETAEASRLKYGNRVQEVMFSTGWYRDNGAKIVTAIEDRTTTVPADDDIISDICALAWIGGVVKIPDKHETLGNDGGKRHADAAIAAMLMEHAASADPVDVTAARTTADRSGGADAYVAPLAPSRQRALTGAGWGTVAGEVNFAGFGEG